MISLVLGDCLERLKDIPDGSVDLILTDPPYGTTRCKWDTVIPFDPMWAEIWRVLKPNGACVLFGSEPFSSALRMGQIKKYKYDWIWNKNRVSNPAMAKKQPLRHSENIMVFNSKIYYPQGLTKCTKKLGGNKKGSKGLGIEVKKDNYKQEFTNYPRHILNIPADNYGKNCWHPTQKPVALLEYLIKTYTLEGETVLDFTMGSGSTGVAAVSLGRKFIGIEKEEKYFKIAWDRVYKEGKFK